MTFPHKMSENGQIVIAMGELLENLQLFDFPADTFQDRREWYNMSKVLKEQAKHSEWAELFFGDEGVITIPRLAKT